MKNTVIILVISDMNAFISKENIDRINASEGTSYPSLENTITYQMLYDSRDKERGYFRTKGGETLWILPYLKGRVTVDPTSLVIKEYSLSEYKVFEQTLDPEEEAF
jgi:hypothetical protein